MLFFLVLFLLCVLCVLVTSTIVFQVKSGGYWYLNALSAPGFNCAGASVPGIPLVFIGRNAHISWSLARSSGKPSFSRFDRREGSRSTESSDVFLTEELFVLDDHHNVKEVAEDSAKTQSGNIDEIRTRTEPIYLPKGGVISITVHESKTCGPVVSHLVTAAARSGMPHHLSQVTLSSQALRQRMNIKFLWKLNTAENWDSFLSAGRELKAIALNVVYADKDGNIGHMVTGRYASAVLHCCS